MEGELSAQVQVFVKVMICDICELFAIVKMMNYVDNVLMRTDSPSSSRKFHMVPVAPPTRQLRAVPVTQITDVCVCIGIDNDLCFVMQNTYFKQKQMSNESYSNQNQVSCNPRNHQNQIPSTPRTTPCTKIRYATHQRLIDGYMMESILTGVALN